MKRRLKMNLELENAKNELEQAINNPNINEKEIYKISSKIDELIIKELEGKWKITKD